jgi:hypothetical protein
VSADVLVEDLLAKTFSAVAATVPSTPPTEWSEVRATGSSTAIHDDVASPDAPARRRKSRGWILPISLVTGLAGVGAAAAAATGVFSSRADHVFRGLYSEPAPAAFGRLPSFNPAKEKLEVTDPGPEGTKISVWTYQESTIQCVAIVESERGKPLSSGKGAGTPGGCSGGVPNPGRRTSTTTVPAPDRTYGGDGGTWRSDAGTLYFLVGSSAPADASRVVLTFSGGTVMSAAVQNGWFAVGFPYRLVSESYSGVFYGPSGHLIPGRAIGQ